MRNKKLTALAVAGGLFLSGQLHADTYLSIGSNPVGNTAYQWAAGISEVVNKNVKGVNAAAEGTKGYVANVQLMPSELYMTSALGATATNLPLPYATSLQSSVDTVDDVQLSPS